jgi:3-hydroxyacyl-CoA dehydrogenase
MGVDRATATDEIFQRMTEQARKLYPNRNAGLVAVEAVRKASQSTLAEGLEFEDLAGQRLPRRASNRGRYSRVLRRARLPPRAGNWRRDFRDAGQVRGRHRAGTMGGGIAICFANAGIPVTLVDANNAALERGLANVDRVYQSMVDRGRLRRTKSRSAWRGFAPRSTTINCATPT